MMFFYWRGYQNNLIRCYCVVFLHSHEKWTIFSSAFVKKWENNRISHCNNSFIVLNLCVIQSCIVAHSPFHSLPFPQSSLVKRFSHEILYYSTESYAVRHERVCDWRRDETVREWSLARFHQEAKELPELWQCSGRVRIKGFSFRG